MIKRTLVTAACLFAFGTVQIAQDPEPQPTKPAITEKATEEAKPAPKLTKQQIRAIAKTKQTMKVLCVNIDSYYWSMDEYPETLVALKDNEFVDEIAKDAWGNDFGYKRTDDEDYVLTSFGADGKQGGAGADTDITFNSEGEFKPLTDAEKKALAEKTKRLERFAKHAVSHAKAVALAYALFQYLADYDKLPEKAENAVSDDLKYLLTDAWGKAFTFKSLPKNNLAVISLGADAKKGGKDENADIVVTEADANAFSGYREEYTNRRPGMDWNADEVGEAIERYTKAKGKAPKTLAELIEAEYINGPPQSWQDNVLTFVWIAEKEAYVVNLGEKGDLSGIEGVFPLPGGVEPDYDDYDEE